MVQQGTIITCWHVENPAALLEQGFVRAFQGSPQKGLLDFLDPNEWHQLRDAVGFNKIASRFTQGGFARALGGSKWKIFFPQKKSRRCAPGGGIITLPRPSSVPCHCCRASRQCLYSTPLRLLIHFMSDRMIKTSMISFIALIARCLRKLLLPMML